MDESVAVFQPPRILSSATGAELLQETNHCLQAGKRKFLVDMSDAMLMDSRGMGCLVTALKRMKAAGGELYLCSLRGQAAILIELSGMESVFQIFPDRAAFEAFLTQKEIGK